MLKICTKCRAQKPLEAFYRERSRRDGLRPWCKSCTNAAIAARAMAHPEAKKQSDQAYYEANKSRRHEQTRQWRSRNPERFREIQRASNHRFRSNHPGANAAHLAVERALKTGTLVRPSRCERCNLECPRLRAHHVDYAQQLAVAWFCEPCHRHHHQNEEKQPCASP